ncbi:MAG: dTDP-4-amino-4,6-dideoxygalactose transaminase [Spirochaetales bacterium]|nr:dTDP-4-amino-4,6-dideoxygalactose transaminase [Spirochaetales bacterium]
MIPFDKKTADEKSLAYIKEALESGAWSGDGPFTKKCVKWFSEQLGTPNVLLTTSCTHALELTGHLADIKEGDEVILPSYTFVSTANPYVLKGAVPVFVDVDPRTMNMDPLCVEEAITERTRAILPVHYGGISCDMDPLCALAEKRGLAVIEDAAQGVQAYYKDRPLGTIGDYGSFSFHGTKNYSCGEGGLVIVKDRQQFERAEIIREKGTNRSRFLRGMIDKYTWVDRGSSYLPSDILAALLLAQLEQWEDIMEKRLNIWNGYHVRLEDLEKQGRIERPFVPGYSRHNGHLYFIKTADIEERSTLIDFLKGRGIATVFHYIPLHSSEFGRKTGRFSGEDKYTTKESERLLRLPLWHGMTEEMVDTVASAIGEFYS